MIRPFNLAEVKIAERNQCRREVERRLRMAALLLGLAIVAAIVSFACKLSIMTNAAKLKSELGDVQQRCVEAKRKMSEVKLLAAQREWQHGLTQGSAKWLAALEDVTGAVPPDAWLARVESSSENNSVAVEGGALSYESLLFYMAALQKTPQVGEVRLTSSRVASAKAAPFVEFGLNVKLKAAASQPESTQPVQPAGVPATGGAE